MCKKLDLETALLSIANVYKISSSTIEHILNYVNFWTHNGQFYIPTSKWVN